MKKALFSLIVITILAACAPIRRVDTSTTPTSATVSAPTLRPELTQEATSAPATLSAEEPLVVAFAKDGDLHLWDSASNQSIIIVKAGDITSVTISDDGKLIAFLRRSLVEQPELIEYVSLWIVNRNGENPHELVSADSLRLRLNPDPKDSAAIAQFNWIPGTHRLVYNASKHYLPGQGFTLSTDLYMVDADTAADAVLAAEVMPATPYINAWRFVISPDGRRIALFSSTELTLLDSDGSNLRRGVLTYPVVGTGDAVLLPRGVWAQDSSAFVFTGPMESASPFVLNYTIWRVPADGSPPQPLVELRDSHSSYISFSPDGGRMAFFQDTNGDGVIQTEDQQIIPLAMGTGPLTLPPRDEQTDVRWSPDGQAFVIKDQNLVQLCAEATNAAQVCGDPISLASGTERIDGFEWVDEDSFLYRVVEPTTLSLGRLDGTITSIISLTEDETWGGWSFYTSH
jgi:dipeptidyl aminopeptidase/acylaminoacyl peptidase